MVRWYADRSALRVYTIHLTKLHIASGFTFYILQKISVIFARSLQFYRQIGWLDAKRLVEVIYRLGDQFPCN